MMMVNCIVPVLVYNIIIVIKFLILIASVLEHGDFIDFNSNPDTGVQRVSCVSIGIEEDLVYTPDRMFLVTLQPVESGDRFDGPSQISIEIVENGENSLNKFNMLASSY